VKSDQALSHVKTLDLDHQLAVIKRGADELLVEEDLVRKLKTYTEPTALVVD